MKLGMILWKLQPLHKEDTYLIIHSNLCLSDPMRRRCIQVNWSMFIWGGRAFQSLKLHFRWISGIKNDLVAPHMTWLTPLIKACSMPSVRLMSLTRRTFHWLCNSRTVDELLLHSWLAVTLWAALGISEGTRWALTSAAIQHYLQSSRWAIEEHIQTDFECALWWHHHQ